MPAARHGGTVFVEGVGGERDDWRALPAIRTLRLGGANAARCLDAVAAGHVQVHEHQTIRGAGRARGEEGLDGRGPVGCERRTMAELYQQRAREQCVDLVVLRDQD